MTIREAIAGWTLAVSVAAMPTVKEAPRVELRYGVPQTVQLDRMGYVAEFDGATRQPRWTLEYLDRSRLSNNASRTGYNFATDVDIPREFRPRLADYEACGFDRGHNCPAGDCEWSERAMRSSYLLSNCSPQDADFNRGAWRELEQHVRSLVSGQNSYKRAWVVTAPLFVPESGKRQFTVQCVGRSKIPVPTHFGKAVLWEDAQGIERAAFSWILPNRKGIANFQDYSCSVDTFERWTGLDLWSELPPDEEKKIEGQEP